MIIETVLLVTILKSLIEFYKLNGNLSSKKSRMFRNKAIKRGLQVEKKIPKTMQKKMMLCSRNLHFNKSKKFINYISKLCKIYNIS